MKKNFKTKRKKKSILNKLVCASLIFSIAVVLSGKIYGNGENMITVSSVNSFSSDITSILKSQGLNIDDLRFIELNDNSDGYNYAYLLDYPSESNIVSANKSLTYSEKLSSGYAYILDNGYPFKEFVVAGGFISSSKANEINYLLTQLAIYSFEYDNKDILLSEGLIDNTSLDGIKELLDSVNDYVINNSGDSISTAISNAINEALKIAEDASSDVLVENTLGFTKVMSADPLLLELNLSDDNQYYESEYQYVYPNYDYSISSNSSDIIILNENGKEQNSFTLEDAFMVKIPVDKFSEDLSITIDTNKNNYSIYSLDEYQSLITLDGQVSKDVNFSVIKRIEIDTELDLTVGDTSKITSEVTPEGTTITWSSNDNSVATVDQNGNVTGVSEGTATITATVADGVSATCTVIVNAKSVEITGVTLNKSELGLNIDGETTNSETLIATLSPSDATNKTLTWKSDNEAVATVDSNGKVTAVSTGTANITVTTSNGKKASCTVTVSTKSVEITGVTLNKSELSLNIGGTTNISETLIATIEPSDATNKTLTWKSDDETVATVDSNGKVTAKGMGITNITVTTINGKTAICSVMVTDVSISRTYNIDLEEEDTYELLSSLSTDDSISQEILSILLGENASWNYGDTSIITVDTNEKATAKKVGSTTVSLTAEGNTIKWNFTVTRKVIAVESITIKDKTSLVVGDTETLNVSFNPSDVTDKILTWKSDNETVATVDQNGNITGVSAGTANVTVTTSNGKTATCLVTVSSKTINVEKVELNKNELTLTTGDLGSIGELKATITPENATNQQLIWSSNNENVVTIDQNGKVIAHKAGTAIITVTSKNNSQITSSCNVVVKDTHLYIKDNATIELQPNQIKQLEIDNTISSEVKWSSSDEDIVKVDEAGKIYALKTGRAEITVEATDGVDNFKDTVIIIVNELTTSEVKKEEMTLEVGKTTNLKYDTDKKVTWESNNSNVAVVDETGKVTAIAEGTTFITGKVDGEVIVQYVVTVKNSTTLLDKIIEVPKTASNIPPYIYIVGIGFILIGMKKVLKH